MENKELEERLRVLELGYTKIESRTAIMAQDVKDIKETLKELAEIAKKQIQTDAVLAGFKQEINVVNGRLNKIENDITWLKKIAYGALLIASVVAPVAIEFFKRMILK